MQKKFVCCCDSFSLAAQKLALLYLLILTMAFLILGAANTTSRPRMSTLGQPVLLTMPERDRIPVDFIPFAFVSKKPQCEESSRTSITIFAYPPGRTV